jgi:hypothetical protein
MIDPSAVNTDYLNGNATLTESAIRREEDEKKKAVEQARVAAQQAEQEAALRKDSHAAKPASQFGAGENMKEIGNALVGGVRDTVSSIATAPERAADMANGQMEKTGDDYKPDWNPLDSGGGDHNPITKTWWGQLIRGGVHFGTMSLAVIGASRLPGVSNVVGKAAASSLGGFIAKNTLARGAALGAATDIVSEYSQGDNATGAIAKRFPALDTPLATHDADHPAVKTLKNVVEGMGIGVIADGVGMAIGKIRDRLGKTTKPSREALQKADSVMEGYRAKAEDTAKADVDKALRSETSQRYFQETGADFNKLSPEQQIELMTKVRGKKKAYQSWNPPETNEQRAARKAEERSKNIEDQVLEKAEVELEDPGFRGHKNKPIADSWQGSPNSTGKAYDVLLQQKRISKEWGAENGSTDAVLTPAAAERMANVNGYTAPVNMQLAKELLGDVRLQTLLKDLRGRRGENGKPLTFDQVFGDAFERMQEVMGRDATSSTPEEFWKPILDEVSFRTGGKESTEAWAMENVIAADLINGSLFKQLRDVSVASRELQGVADILDVDGPGKTIADRLIVGLTNVKRSRYLISEEFRSLQAQDPTKAARQRTTRLAELHEESRSAVQMMMDLAANADTDDFLQATLEAFSMSNKISNWMDFDGWMRKRLLGETTESGAKKTGALIKELEGVMVHSILSGPKTPVRAVMGTATATFLRPISTAIGAAMRGDGQTVRTALASTNAMMQAIPEAFSLFRTKLNSYWAGDIADIRTRFSEYNPKDEQWELMQHWAENRGTEAEKAAFRLANMARSMNDNKFLTYSTRIMAATDDTFGFILGRARAREKALLESMNLKATGDVVEVTPDLIKAFEDRFMGEIFDADGNVLDSALNFAKKESTLTNDLTGFAKGLEEVFSRTPWAKPFFLFARTGINGLALTAKHTPGFNFLVKEFNDIAFASVDNLDSVRKYGIETAQDLANAKALQTGRLAIGSSVITMAGFHFLNGGLTGNGPQDRQKQQIWIDAGWKPRSIRMGDIWVSYDSFEPFNQILAAVADIGDNMELMGPEWAEQNLAKQALLVAQTATSKSYLQGVSQFVDLFSGDPKAFSRITAGLLNNTVPLSGLRNDIGKIITPHQRELGSGIEDALRNRNLSSEYLTSKDLPRKYDLLNGKPINDWDFPTRMFNAVSPIQFNLDQGKGRTLLFNSGYDMRLSTYVSPTGVSLADSPRVRSLFQQAIGRQNLEATLDKLADRKDVKESVDRMNWDRNNGRRFIDPMKAYMHNDLISNAFDTAKKKAWAEIQSNPEVVKLVSKKNSYDRAVINTRSQNESGAAQAALEFTQRTKNK